MNVLASPVKEEPRKDNAHVAPQAHHHSFPPTQIGFIYFFIAWEILMIILHITLTKYGPGADPMIPDPNLRIITSFYAMWQDIHVMIFIGFGFLMTFLRKYGYGAVGFTLLVSCICIQWHILVSAFWEGVILKHFSRPAVTVEKLALADFAAGAVLISFGGMIGKISPLQLGLMAIVEVTLYALNEAIGLYVFYITDVGGSFTIHMFGAYFGLAATFLMSQKKAKDNADNAPVYHSDLFAMIGTVFLWLFWPSFNGAVSATPQGSHRAIVNTVMSLTGCTITSFAFSTLIRKEKKFNMVDVQNATLAGGVAIGAAADLIVMPGVSLAIGCLTGIVSTFGFARLQAYLQEKIGLHDSCGIHNLHGMPSVIGVIVNIIVCAIATRENYGAEYDLIFKRGSFGREGQGQAGYQVAYAGTTLLLAIGGGIITGGLLSLPVFRMGTFYTDELMWEVPAQETPFYFDEHDQKLELMENKVKMLEKMVMDSNMSASVRKPAVMSDLDYN